MTTNEPELIQTFLEMTIPRIQGEISVLGNRFMNSKALRIEINGVIDTIDYLIYANNGGRLGVCRTRCYDVKPHGVGF